MPETKGFDAFVTARFNWTAKLNAVWAEPKFDVNGVHAHVVDEIMAAVDERGTWTDDGVLGQLIIGEAGSGSILRPGGNTTRSGTRVCLGTWRFSDCMAKRCSSAAVRMSRYRVYPFSDG